ncbi:hypothetical protein QYF36_008323 [Acer negundo]|nr:hypothetical protein QYF36_008323 [Acer negundo]
MPPCLLSYLPPSLLISCSASPGVAAVAVRTPPQLPSPSLSLDSTTTLLSLSCSLQCSHFQSCSGCTHEFNLHRPIIVDDATDFFKNHGVSDFTFDTCRLYGWRCRAKLAVRGTPMSPLIGLYQEGTHNVADIPDCKAHHPGINAAVELLRQGIKELNIELYDEDQGTGDLRYVQMAVTTHNTSLHASERYRNGKVQITLVWNSRNEKSSNSDKLDALVKFLWRNGGSWSKNHHIHSVWANFQTSTTNVGSLYTRVKKLCRVSIIRSGESIENALRACCKGIKIGKIMIHRDGDDGKQLIYEKLPKDISERHVLLLDPVLATGNSANQAIELLIQKGVPESHIIFLNLISAPEGIDCVCKRFPSLKIVTSEIYVSLNEEFSCHTWGDQLLHNIMQIPVKLQLRISIAARNLNSS